MPAGSNFLQYADQRGTDIQGLTALGGQIGGYPTQYTVPSQAPAYNMPVPGQMVGQEAQESMMPTQPSQAPAMPFSAPSMPEPYQEMGAPPMIGPAPNEGPYTPMGEVVPAPGAVGGSFAPPSDEQMGYNYASDRPTGQTGDFYQAMLNQGIPEHIAAGFMMNAKDESGFDLEAVGDNGNAKGLLQWNGPRKKLFEEMFNNDWSADNQAAYLKWELEGPENAAWQDIQKTTTAGEAAAAIVNKFERPAEEHRARREAAYLGGQGDTSTTGVAVSSKDSPSEGADDNEDLAEAMYGPKDVENSRRQKIADGLAALGVGLGQMSHGETVDISKVTAAIAEREWRKKVEMREVYQERTRKAERNENFDREDAQINAAMQARIAERNQDRTWKTTDDAAARAHDYGLAFTGHGYKLGELAATNAAALEQANAGFTRNIAIGHQMLRSADPITQRAGQVVVDTMGATAPDAAWKEVNPTSPMVSIGDKRENVILEHGLKAVDAKRAVIAEKASANQALENMTLLYESAGWDVQGGPITQALIPHKAALKEMGLLSDDESQMLSIQQSIQQQKFRGIPAVKTEGQVSEYEQKAFLAALPGIDNPTLTSRLSLQIMNANAAAEIQNADMLEAYVYEHGSAKDFEKYYAKQVEEGHTPQSLVKTSDLFANTDKTANMIAGGYLKPGMLVAGVDETTGKMGLVPLTDQAYDYIVSKIEAARKTRE